MTKQICVARIGAAHGVRGAVKLWTFTEDPLAVLHYGPLAFKDGARTLVVTHAREARDHLVATLQGVTTRDDAEKLNGVELYIARDKLPATDDDEYYHADLIGLSAETTAGEAIGRVSAIHNFGAGDVIDLQRDGKFPSENFILDPRGHNSLTRIRRFVESFGAPVPVEVDKDERRFETTLACWEAMLDFNDRFMNDEPIVPSACAMLKLWVVAGPLQMRRWAIPAADLALRIHNHLRERLVGPPTPFDHDFVPAVIEVLSWTQTGPVLPGSTEEAAVKVLGKLADYREKRR